jgi:hypothetical protein
LYSKIFNSPVESRLSLWLELRQSVETSHTPLEDVWDFWRQSPFIPYNNKIDPYNKRTWPNPWSIIADNRYDEFTRALMIGWTLKLTNRYKNSKIELKTLVDNTKNSSYNVIFIDNEWVINYSDNGPIAAKSMPISFYLENLIELEIPR